MPSTCSVSTLGLAAIVRITSGSPGYAFGIGVYGSPNFVDENHSDGSSPRPASGSARRLIVESTPATWSIGMYANSRNEPVMTPGISGFVVWMSASVPERISAPVSGSWYVEPFGSTTIWPTMPRCHVCRPSTWSWKNTLSSTTSGYQRDWTNSTPAHSPAGWSRFRGAASVTVFATGSIAWIVAGSMSSVPSPSAIEAPRWNLATLVRCTTVEPAAEPEVICGSSSLYGRTDCSYENPEITP